MFFFRLLSLAQKASPKRPDVRGKSFLFFQNKQISVPAEACLESTGKSETIMGRSGQSSSSLGTDGEERGGRNARRRVATVPLACAGTGYGFRGRAGRWHARASCAHEATRRGSCLS